MNDLIQASRPEGLTIEYKRDPYGKSDADKKEALKDITAFANSAGGHLIIGMEGADGVPTGLTGLPGVDPDALTNRLELLVRDGVEPRIVGVRMRAVGLSGGGAVLVIRIPRSWNPPHRVSAAKSNRFYVRNSGGAHEANVEELRVLFTLAADAQQRIKAFRSDRITTIAAGQGPVPLPTNGRMIVHLVPLSAFVQVARIDLGEGYELSYHPVSLGQPPRLVKFRPMGQDTPRARRFNLDGYITVSEAGLRCSYTQVFRNGILEATQAGVVDEVRGIAFLKEGFRTLVQVLPSYFEGLRELEVPAPIVVMVSYQDVKGARLWNDFDFERDKREPLPPVDPLLLPEEIVDDYGSPEDYVRKLRPIFDVLWNSAGFGRCPFYDADGNLR